MESLKEAALALLGPDVRGNPKRLVTIAKATQRARGVATQPIRHTSSKGRNMNVK